jgi:hypothetical protein
MTDDVTLLQQALNGDSLKSPPSGGEMRLPDAQTEPWKELGISRATWYRQNKPQCMTMLASASYQRQKVRARSYDKDVRSVQRLDFAYRYGIEELRTLVTQNLLPPGMLEGIAKWEPEDQQRFIDRLIDLGSTLPQVSWRFDDAEWPIKTYGPTGGLLRVEPAALRRAARQARNEIVSP